MAGIPGIKSTRFYHKKWFAELLGSVPPIIAAIVAAVTNLLDATDSKKSLAYLGFGIAGWLFVAGLIKILQASKQDNEETRKYDYDGLKATLYVLHGGISRTLGFKESEIENGRLRVTIHRVDSDELEQLLPYIGGTGGASGRRFSIRSGIIGKAVREGKAVAATRENENYGAYVNELVSKRLFKF